MLHNIYFCLNNMDSRFSRVENFLVSYSTSGDLTDPLGDLTDALVGSVQDLIIISFD